MVYTNADKNTDANIETNTDKNIYMSNFFEPDKEVHQVDDVRGVVKDHPQVVRHVPENSTCNDKEDIVEDGNGYHLKVFGHI